MKKIRKVLAVVLTLALMLSLFSDGISATLNEMLPNGETEMTVEGSIESSVGMGDEPYVAPPTPETVIFGAVNGGYMPEVTLGGISDKVVSGNTVTYTYNDTDFGPVNVTVKFSCSTNSHSLNAPVGSAGPIFDYCDKIDISFDFYKVPDGQLAKSQLSIPLTIPSEGNLFDLPNYYDNKDIRINDVVNGSIYVAGDYHYDPANGNLVLNFNSKFTSPDTKNRNFNVYVEVIPPEPGDDYQNDKEFKLHLWDQDYNFSYHDSEGTVNAQKSAEVFEFIPQKDGQPAKLIIKYTAKAVVSGRAQDLTIQDLITANDSSAYKLIQDSIKVVHDNNGHSSPEFTYDSTGNVNGFTMNFPGDYKNGDYVQVEYLVEYTGDQLDKWSKGENLDYNAYVNKLTAKGKKYALNEVIPDSNATSGLPYLANTGLYKSNTWTSKVVDGKAYYVATYTGSIDFSAFYNNLDAASKSEIDGLVNGSNLPGAIEKLLEMYGRQSDIKDELYVGETRYADLSDKIKSNLTVNSPFDGKFNFSYTVDIEADKVTDGEIVKNKLTVGNGSTEDSGFNPNQKEEVTGRKWVTNGYNKESGEIRWHDEFSLPKVYDRNLLVTDTATIDVPASLNSKGEWKHLIDIDSIKIYANGTEIDKDTYGIVITPSSGLSDYFTVSFSDGDLYSNLINSGNGQTVTNLSIEYNTKVTLNGEVYEFGEGEGLTAYNEFIDQKVEAKVEGKTIPIEGSFKKEKLDSDPEDDDYTFKWRISLTGNPFKWENGQVTLDTNYKFSLTDIPHDMEVLDLAEDGHLKNLSFKRFDNQSEYGDWNIGFYMGLINNKTINGDVTKSGQEIYDELRSGIVQRLCSMIKVTENGDGSVDLVYNPSDPALGSQVEEFNRWINSQPLIVNNEWNGKYDFGKEVLANADNYITITYKTKFAGMDASSKSEVDAFIKGDTIPLTNILRGTVNGSLPFESKPSVQIKPKKFLVKSGFEYKEDNIEKADQAYYTNLSYDYQSLDFFKGENFKKYVEAYYSSGDINAENNFLTNYLYVIDVNPDALKFGTQGYIEVQDIMGNGLTLAESSVRLVEVNGTPGAYTSGTAYKLYQQGSGFSLTKDNVPGEDNKNHSYTFRMKDGQHYLLVYWARVVYSVDSDGNFITSDNTDDYKNSVTVDGYGLIPVEGSTRFNGSNYASVNGSSSGITKTQFVFKFHKIGVEDVNVWTDLAGVGFTFTPYIWDGSVGNGELKLVTDYSSCSVKSDEDGLGSVSLEKAYIYEVTENLETVPEGYEGFDKKVYVVFKETFDNLSKEAQDFLESGDLRVIESSIDEQKFFNTKTENKGSLKVTKKVENPNGVGIPTDDEFTFTVSFNTSAEIPDPTYVGNETGKDITKSEDESNTEYKSFEFTLKNGESVLFTGIPVGTEYNVVETPKENYISTSSNASGTVTGTETPTVEVTYTNIYNVIAKDVPKLYKKLDGKPADKQFTFKVETDFKPADGAAYDGSGTVQNNKDGEIILGKITFYKAGDYEIRVSEDDGGDSNILYDTKTIVIKYSVTTGKDGKLAVSDPTYCDKDGNEVTGEYANTFNNFTGTSKELKVNKKLVPKTGDSAYLDKAVTFTFKAEVEDAADNKATDESIVNKTVSVTVPAGVITSTSLFEAAEEFKFSFSEEGNYSYKISENDDKSTNVDYDGKIHTVEFTVENVEGKLTVTTVKVDGEEVSEPDIAAEFENKYTSITGEGKIDVEKSFEGGDWHGTSYVFELKNIDEGIENAPMPSADATASITLTKPENAVIAEGSFDFTFDNGKLQIPLNGQNVFNYEVKESATTEKGVTIDVAVYKVTLTVKNNGTQLVAEKAVTKYLDKVNGKVDETFSGETLKFVNKYQPDQTSAPIEIKKEVTGGYKLKGEDFRFEIKALPEDSTSTPMPSHTTVSNDINGDVSFGNISYTKVGTYYYVIQEIVPDPEDRIPGMTYSNDKVYVTVTVSDTDGVLSASVAYSKTDPTVAPVQPSSMRKAAFTLMNNEGGNDDDKTIVNTYETYKADGKLSLKATKTLTGRDMKAGEFNFAVKEGEKVVAEATNDADGNIVFPDIAYTLDDVGEHTYTVYEVKGDLKGVKYSSTNYVITVTVADGGDGKLTVTSADMPDEMLFKNEYKADGKLNLKATKTLTGRDMKAGEFNFAVKEGEEIVAEATNDADGNIVFPEITYTLEDVGEHTYTVYEVKGDLKGVTYSSTNYVITVTVADGGDGKLTVTSADMPDEMLFKNEYKADGTATIEAAKTLTGKTLVANQFTFKAEELDSEGNVIKTFTGANNAAGKISITIPYTQEDLGIHTYKVTEVNDKKPGYTYSENALTVTVTVSDNGDGTLKTEIEYAEGEKTFINTYKAEGEATIEAAKTLTGKTLAAGDFTFSAVEVDDNNKPIENAKTFTGANDANGKISIEITYTQDDSEGAHRYLVSEVKDDKDGIVYSDLQFIATVNVTDNGDGTITASEPVYTKLDGTVITDMTDRTFGNTYNEATGSFSLAGFKRVEGDTYGKSADYQYSFTVTEDGKSETVTAKAGMIEFIKNRVYTEKDEGKHVITISENDVPENRHITTDKAVYTVTVNVTPGEYHTIKVEIESIAKSGAEGNVNIEFTRDGTGNNYYTSEKLEFVNTYKVETVSVPFTATKTVSGRPAGKWYEGDKYSFTLKGLDGAKMPAGAEDGTATAENVAGTVAFGTVTYDESDIGKTYTYEVREVIDNKVEGVKYDGSVYTVEVTVTENADGTLKADTVYKKGEEIASGILFANEYETEKTNAKFNLSVNKKLAGDPAPEETYVFTVDGTDYKASVKGEGSAEIISAEYDKAGTYVYNVRETKGSTVGMEYDGRYYQVTATVTETTEPNGDITLKVEDVKIIHRNADGSEIASVDKDNVTFTNTYRKPVKTPVSYSLKAEKSVEGNAPEDYSYSFEITKDGVSTLLENVKPGEFEFINETYDEAGEHTYTVREIPGGLPGMTYDGAEYTVKTTVTEHTDPATGDKSYTVEAVITKNGASASEVEFVNVYKVGGFSVEKEVSGTKGVTETERDWNFTVELDTALNGTYGDMTFTEGRSSFTLKSGEKLTAENIPVGVTYKVTETDADTDGYTTSVEGVTAAEVTEELKMVKFINHKDKDKVGLSVEKIVTGTAGETDRDFNFTVTLSDNTINGAYGEMTFVNGVARFTLRHGQKKAASGLPADIGYKVVETEANLDDYVTTSQNDEGQIPEGGTAAAVFVNSRDRKVGSLTVRKQVTGEGAEAGRRFTFSVVLSDVTVNGQYGDMYFNSGRAVFTLAHGQSATAMGLPVGISYNVIELDAGDYTSTALGASGVITENGFAETVYINNKDKIPEFGGLSVTKTVVGEGFDPDQEFTFTVTLDDGTINGTYGDISFSGGVATFKLKNGESAYADNLPAGTGYTVTEEDVEDYVQSSTGSSGTVEADRIANASFVNTYEAPATSGFGVSKTVTGTAAEPERVFTFLVTLSDSEINGVYGDMVFSGGTATLFLSSGQTAYADGLPIGTGYSVTEIDAEDYQVSSVGASGTVEEGVYAMAAFINHKDAPAPEVPLEEEGPGPYGDDMGAGQYGKDKRTGDDMGAGAFGDDMNPATGDYETENAANTTAMIAVLWALVFIFGAVVIRRKKD